jgi:hypothetical protein
MDMEQQDIQTGRTKRASQKTSRYKKLDKHVHGNHKFEKTWHRKGIRNKDNSRNYWKLQHGIQAV